MRKKLSYFLLIIAVLAFGFFAVIPANQQAVTANDIDYSLPLSWPPRAEDGRRESFFNAIALYFRTLFSADELIQDAHSVADRAAQRQRQLDNALEPEPSR